MGRKLSVGIKVTGCIQTFLSSYFICFISFWGIYADYSSFHQLYHGYGLSGTIHLLSTLLVFFLLVISGVGLIILKAWSRTMTIILMLLFIALFVIYPLAQRGLSQYWFYDLVYGIIPFLYIIFLTRPRVKEHFK